MTQAVTDTTPLMPDRLSVELSRRLARFFAESGADALAKAAIVDRVIEAAMTDDDVREGSANLTFEDLPGDLQAHVRRVEALARSRPTSP